MTEPLLRITDLACHFPVRQGGGLFARKRTLKAVDGVDLELPSGRTLALVGESGCGKSTTARLALGLLQPTAGDVRFEGAALPPERTPAWRSLRRRMQLVYQDPMAALDRRQPIAAQIREPLDIHRVGTQKERADEAARMLDAVGLQPHQAGRYPHELSGGQRQRVVLARALILRPKLLVLDEPISALDVSIQAQIVNLLEDLQRDFALAFLFISHDLKVVRQIAHEVAVMYLGRIVEHGHPDAIFARPAHPYTRALVSAIPTTRPASAARIVLQGDPPSPIDVPGGCPFHTRCPIAADRCRTDRPELLAHADGRRTACHFADAPPLRAAA